VWVFHAGTRQHVASRVRPEDAALVAAAPELLEALEDILRETPGGALPRALLATANAAIAKVRGRREDTPQ
jgi:hypothetical protein